MGLVTLNFRPFDIETGVSVTCVLGYLLTNFGLPSAFGSRVILYVRDRQTDRQTDGQTDGQKQRLMPPTLRAGA